MSSLKVKLPEVRIGYGWLLADAASNPMNELWGEGKPLRTFKQYKAIADRYNKAWEPVGKEILAAMCNMLGLEFRQNIIDVYIAPWFHAFSDPMVIGVTFSDDAFIATLTHEIFHRLLTDNTSLPYETDLLTLWGELFGSNHTTTALIHIPVHAGCKAIFLDVLKRPELLEDDLKKTKKWPDYYNAWEYVQSRDYKKIISDLKQSYKQA